MLMIGIDTTANTINSNCLIKDDNVVTDQCHNNLSIDLTVPLLLPPNVNSCPSYINLFSQNLSMTNSSETPNANSCLPSINLCNQNFSVTENDINIGSVQKFPNIKGKNAATSSKTPNANSCLPSINLCTENFSVTENSINIGSVKNFPNIKGKNAATSSEIPNANSCPSSINVCPQNFGENNQYSASNKIVEKNVLIDHLKDNCIQSGLKDKHSKEKFINNALNPSSNESITKLQDFKSEEASDMIIIAEVYCGDGDVNYDDVNYDDAFDYGGYDAESSSSDSVVDNCILDANFEQRTEELASDVIRVEEFSAYRKWNAISYNAKEEDMKYGLSKKNQSKRCCVCCRPGTPKRRLHRFPRYTVLSDRWAKACNRKWISIRPHSKRRSSLRVCSDHFLPSDYISMNEDKAKRLKFHAVPSVFPPKLDELDTTFVMKLKDKLRIALNKNHNQESMSNQTSNTLPLNPNKIVNQLQETSEIVDTATVSSPDKEKRIASVCTSNAEVVESVVQTSNLLVKPILGKKDKRFSDPTLKNSAHISHLVKHDVNTFYAKKSCKSWSHFKYLKQKDKSASQSIKENDVCRTANSTLDESPENVDDPHFKISKDELDKFETLDKDFVSMLSCSKFSNIAFSQPKKTNTTFSYYRKGKAKSFNQTLQAVRRNQSQKTIRNIPINKINKRFSGQSLKKCKNPTHAIKPSNPTGSKTDKSITVQSVVLNNNQTSKKEKRNKSPKKNKKGYKSDTLSLKKSLNENEESDKQQSSNISHISKAFKTVGRSKTPHKIKQKKLPSLSFEKPLSEIEESNKLQSFNVSEITKIYKPIGRSETTQKVEASKSPKLSFEKSHSEMAESNKQHSSNISQMRKTYKTLKESETPQEVEASKSPVLSFKKSHSEIAESNKQHSSNISQISKTYKTLERSEAPEKKSPAISLEKSFFEIVESNKQQSSNISQISEASETISERPQTVKTNIESSKTDTENLSEVDKKPETPQIIEINTSFPHIKAESLSPNPEIELLPVSSTSETYPWYLRNQISFLQSLQMLSKLNHALTLKSKNSTPPNNEETFQADSNTDISQQTFIKKEVLDEDTAEPTSSTEK